MDNQPKRHISPIYLATTTALITAMLALFATVLAGMTNIKTITPLFQILYGQFGYSISITGSLIAALYTAIDTFIIIYIFAWIYNKLL